MGSIILGRQTAAACIDASNRDDHQKLAGFYLSVPDRPYLKTLGTEETAVSLMAQWIPRCRMLEYAVK